MARKSGSASSFARRSGHSSTANPGATSSISGQWLERLRPKTSAMIERRRRACGAFTTSVCGGAQRAQHGAQEMHAISDGAERQISEELAEQRVQRIAGRVLDAEEIAREDEEAVVLQRHRARRGEGVEDQQGERHQPGFEPVSTWGHRRPLSAVGVLPPQVKEAVVRKFQKAATPAPMSPATQ